MPPPRPPRRITILGGGLSGLSAAYQLARVLPSIGGSSSSASSGSGSGSGSSSSTASNSSTSSTSTLGNNSAGHTEITLIESSARVGGWVDSRSATLGFKGEDGKMREGDVVLESGPRSIRPRGSRGASGMLRMLRDLDMIDSIIPVSHSHPAAKNRFLLNTSTSKLTALPSSLTSLIRPQPPLLRGLVRSVLYEPFRPRRSSSPSSASSGSGNDESVDSFFRRRFGEKIATNLASAMVHGIYAASSTSLSVRSAFPSLWDSEQARGSVVAGMLLGTGLKTEAEKQDEQREWDELGELGKERLNWSLYGLKGGLGSLTNRLTDVVRKAGIDIRTEEKVEKINLIQRSKAESGQGGEGEIEIHTSNGQIIKTDHIISALPPPVLSSLLPSSTSNASSSLSSPSPSLSLPHLNANPYTSVGVVNIVYPLPPSSVHPAGFGYLIPRPDNSSHRSSSSTDEIKSNNPSGVLGVIFDSTAIPFAPAELEGQITKLTIMMGGPYWSTYQPLLQRPTSPSSKSGSAGALDQDELLHKAIEHLNLVFPHLKGTKPILASGRIHSDCIPTYLPNHGDRLRELHRALLDGPWSGKLSLVGNGYGGVGVNDCVYSSENVVKALLAGDDVTGLERWADWE